MKDIRRKIDAREIGSDQKGRVSEKQKESEKVKYMWKNGGKKTRLRRRVKAGVNERDRGKWKVFQSRINGSRKPNQGDGL